MNGSVGFRIGKIRRLPFKGKASLCVFVFVDGEGAFDLDSGIRDCFDSAGRLTMLCFLECS